MPVIEIPEDFTNEWTSDGENNGGGGGGGVDAKVTSGVMDGSTLKLTLSDGSNVNISDVELPQTAEKFLVSGAMLPSPNDRDMELELNDHSNIIIRDAKDELVFQTTQHGNFDFNAPPESAHHINHCGMTHAKTNFHVSMLDRVTGNPPLGAWTIVYTCISTTDPLRQGQRMLYNRHNNKIRVFAQSRTTNAWDEAIELTHQPLLPSELGDLISADVNNVPFLLPKGENSEVLTVAVGIGGNETGLAWKMPDLGLKILDSLDFNARPSVVNYAFSWTETESGTNFPTALLKSNRKGWGYCIYIGSTSQGYRTFYKYINNEWSQIWTQARNSGRWKGLIKIADTEKMVDFLSDVHERLVKDARGHGTIDPNGDVKCRDASTGGTRTMLYLDVLPRKEWVDIEIDIKIDASYPDIEKFKFTFGTSSVNTGFVFHPTSKRLTQASYPSFGSSTLGQDKRPKGLGYRQTGEFTYTFVGRFYIAEGNETRIMNVYPASFRYNSVATVWITAMRVDECVDGYHIYTPHSDANIDIVEICKTFKRSTIISFDKQDVASVTGQPMRPPSETESDTQKFIIKFDHIGEGSGLITLEQFNDEENDKTWKSTKVIYKGLTHTGWKYEGNYIDGGKIWVKGDLLVHSGEEITALHNGNGHFSTAVNGKVLTIDNDEITGLSWQAPSSGGAFKKYTSLNFEAPPTEDYVYAWSGNAGGTSNFPPEVLHSNGNPQHGLGYCTFVRHAGGGNYGLRTFYKSVHNAHYQMWTQVWIGGVWKTPLKLCDTESAEGGGATELSVATDVILGVNVTIPRDRYEDIEEMKIILPLANTTYIIKCYFNWYVKGIAPSITALVRNRSQSNRTLILDLGVYNWTKQSSANEKATYARMSQSFELEVTTRIANEVIGLNAKHGPTTPATKILTRGSYMKAREKIVALPTVDSGSNPILAQKMQKIDHVPGGYSTIRILFTTPLDVAPSMVMVTGNPTNDQENGHGQIKIAVKHSTITTHGFELIVHDGSNGSNDYYFSYLAIK